MPYPLAAARSRASLPLAVAGGQSALYQSLVAYWKLDEASGNRADSIGANTLTDNNTVGSATGLPYALAADFEDGSAEYLSIADNAALSVGDIDFWFAAWVKFESGGDSRTILSKRTEGDTNNEHQMLRDGSSLLSWAVWNTSDVATVITASTFGALADGTWYLLFVWHDSINNVIGAAVNAGAANTTAHTTGVRDFTTDFRIGRLGAFSSAYMDGLIGPLMFGKGYIPDADDRSFLYGGGSGKTLQQVFEYAG